MIYNVKGKGVFRLLLYKFDIFRLYRLSIMYLLFKNRSGILVVRNVNCLLYNVILLI